MTGLSSKVVAGFRGPGMILLMIAGLLLLFSDEGFAGLSTDETAVLIGIGAVMLFAAGHVVEGFRRSGLAGLNALIAGGLTCAFLIAAFVSRSDIATVLDRMIGDLAPGRTVTTESGEVIAAKRLDGGFALNAKINGQPARLIFDTGASTVVLRPEDAAKFGIKSDTLSYSVPVSTANGTTLAATVTLDTITIGPITERRVSALVTKPGVLHANLLGMTFLERLDSYEVRGNRLILRGGVDD